MVFRRVRDLFVASIHEGLDKMEEPEVMLNQYIRDVERDISKAKRSILDQQVMEKTLVRKTTEAQGMIVKRKNQAQIAVQAGEEDLARKALTEMKYYETKAEQYQEQAEIIAKHIQELREQISHLEKRFQDVKDKKYELIARAEAVQAKKRVYQSLHHLDSESSFKKIQKLEERIAEMEIKVTTMAETETTQRGLEKLEYADQVEKELAELRSNKPVSF